ncbi:MAG: hypothetical protein RLO80_06585 [Hyphomonas sp.]
MAKPFLSEPLHADINWSEEDNKRNSERYLVWFEDIESGFARPHVRTDIQDNGEFTALLEVENIIFNVRCRAGLSLTIIAAAVATSHDKATYYKTLSQSS